MGSLRFPKSSIQGSSGLAGVHYSRALYDSQSTTDVTDVSPSSRCWYDPVSKYRVGLFDALTDLLPKEHGFSCWRLGSLYTGVCMQQRLRNLYEPFPYLTDGNSHAKIGFKDAFPFVDAVTWVCLVLWVSIYSLCSCPKVFFFFFCMLVFFSWTDSSNLFGLTPLRSRADWESHYFVYFIYWIRRACIRSCRETKMKSPGFRSNFRTINIYSCEPLFLRFCLSCY